MADRLTVDEAGAAYESAMRNVLPSGPGVCSICHTFIDPEYTICYPCRSQPNHLDAVVPITYSENLGQMHTALRNYKDGHLTVQNYALPRLTGILWRFAAAHEDCVARASGVAGFDVVATVPSSTTAGDDQRANLRTMVEWSDPLKDRFLRVLRATGEGEPGRSYDESRYVAPERLDGMNVLVIDDTWTAGGHAQSAAHALRAAGADHVGAIVIGRHVSPAWEVAGKTSAELLAALPKIFDWTTCAVH